MVIDRRRALRSDYEACLRSCAQGDCPRKLEACEQRLAKGSALEAQKLRAHASLETQRSLEELAREHASVTAENNRLGLLHEETRERVDSLEKRLATEENRARSAAELQGKLASSERALALDRELRDELQRKYASLAAEKDKYKTLYVESSAYINSLGGLEHIKLRLEEDSESRKKRSLQEDAEARSEALRCKRSLERKISLNHALSEAIQQCEKDRRIQASVLKDRIETLQLRLARANEEILQQQKTLQEDREENEKLRKRVSLQEEQLDFYAYLNRMHISGSKPLAASGTNKPLPGPSQESNAAGQGPSPVSSKAPLLQKVFNPGRQESSTVVSPSAKKIPRSTPVFATKGVKTPRTGVGKKVAKGAK